MELFSEIYNCYYQIVDQILREAEKHPVTEQEMNQICGRLGFAESSLYIVPKLTGGEWNLLTPDRQGYRARTRDHGDLPLTLLQRSWLKTLLQDDRFRLFFTGEELFLLKQYTEAANVLWHPEDFRCYDQYTDGDPFASPSYREHFRTLLAAIKSRQYVNISYQSEKGNRITHHYLPLKLEYSAKNDRFRLLTVPKSQRHSAFIQTLNLRGITSAALLPSYDEEDYDFEQVIRKSYYQEPVRLQIKNRRNALERAMLHFSNYEKRTRKIDEDTWECLIYYNRSMETELLIEILSFGPAVKVTGPDPFVALVKERLKRQAALLQPVILANGLTPSPS